MRPLRILESAFSPVTIVHLMSRVIERRKVLDDVTKEKFREMLARQSAFSQIDIVTFCILSNHFHLLARFDRSEPNPLADAPDQDFGYARGIAASLA